MNYEKLKVQDKDQPSLKAIRAIVSVMEFDFTWNEALRLEELACMSPDTYQESDKLLVRLMQKSSTKRKAISMSEFDERIKTQGDK